MRTLHSIGGWLGLAIAVAACGAGPAAPKEAPVLRVSSPERGLLRAGAGPLTVSGTVEPNDDGVPVDKVVVNGVTAALDADGAFRATVDVGEGATLIETVATDRDGTAAHDTRAVQAGALRAVGESLPGAITVALSTDAFTQIAAAAGPALKGMDFGAMLAPLQPMVSFGSASNGARAYIDDLDFASARLSLSPVQGGLAFRAEIDQLDVPAHASYALGGIGGQLGLRITATKIAVAGTLRVTPNGAAGFTTKLLDPDVTVTGFHLASSAAIDTVLGWLQLDSAIETIVAKAAEIAMNPLMNQALGALGGPQQLTVLGKALTLQVAPSAITFTATGATVAMNLKVLLAGGEASPGFIFTSNGMPVMDPRRGFQIGVADDLVNELLAEAKGAGLLDLTMPAAGGTFDAAQIRMTLPPMITADAADRRMRLVLGDLIATYTYRGEPVVRAAINARVDLGVEPDGATVALRLGKPEIHVDVLDGLNRTGLDRDTLATATTATLGAQLDTLSKLLVSIPLPSVAGLQAYDVSIGADVGYVMMRGGFR